MLFVAVLLYCACYWLKMPANGQAQDSQYGGGVTVLEGEKDGYAEIEGEVLEQPKETQQPKGAEAGVQEPEVLPEGFSDIMAVVANGPAAQGIKLYVQDGLCYFFLPSYADPEQVTWKYDESCYTVTCGGHKVHSGDRLGAALGEETPVTFRQHEEGWEKEYGLTVMCSEGLPALYIDTDGGGTVKREKEDALEGLSRFLCVSEDGKKDAEGEGLSIAEKEYQDFSAAKKNYEILLRDGQDILGLGIARQWRLQANAYDLSRVRCKTVYDLAKDMGMVYGIESSYADLWFDGEYVGNYLVCRESAQGENVFLYSNGETYGIRAADGIEKTAFGQGELESIWAEISDAIENCSSEADYRALRELIDIDSFIQMYLLSELANEPGLNRESPCYLSKTGEGGGKIYASLPVEFDGAFGNADGTYLEGLVCYVPGLCDRLFKCAYFRQDVQESFNRQYAPLVERYINRKIGEYCDRIAVSLLMDGLRWQAQGNSYMEFNESYETPDAAARYVEYYLNARYWLVSQYLNEPGQWHRIEYADKRQEGIYSSMRYQVRDGEKVPDQVTEYLEEAYGCDGWEYEDGRDCETGRPVYCDMRLLAQGDNVAGQKDGEMQGKETAEAVSGQEAPEAGQETAAEGNTGYSKRFVVLCMLFAAGVAGVCGLAMGMGATAIFSKRKKSR